MEDSNRRINGHTRTCGLIGNPVEHTLSPVIHNTLAQIQGDNLVYVPFHVQEGLAGEALKGAYALNLLGLNVTVPYKSEVIPYLREVDPLAKKIGAVNTLVRMEGGYKGYNTDMPGLLRAMKEDGVGIRGEKVLVLGAGGVARAVVMLLACEGAEQVYVLNRTPGRAEEIASQVNSMEGRMLVQAMSLKDYDKLPQERLLAIQTTSVGMHPHVEEAVLEEAEFYRRIHTGYDLVMNPANTRFMQLAEAQGGRAFNGLKMLLYQGIIAYELWTGKAVDAALAAQIYGRLQKAAYHTD